jgi:hypothetical protein
MRSSIRKLGFLLLPLLISACAGGGGGGGGSGGGVVVTPFTSWSAIQPNTVVQATGGSAGANYTANPVTGQVLTVSTPEQTSSGATINFTYGPTSLTGISIQSAQGTTASLNTLAGDTIANDSTGSILFGQNAALTTTLLAPSPDYFGWNYQSFGVWITGQGTGAGSVGVASVGSATPVTGIPATGSSTFAGATIGVFVDSSGSAFYTAGLMTASVNFGAQTAVFATRNTEKVNLATGLSSSASNLNLNSNMTYAGGVISGAVTSVSGMTGTASGKFFGPSAQEIGGTYVLQGGGASLVGGFGGTR